MNTPTRKLRELKARKAKFGFQYGTAQLDGIVFIAKVHEALKNNEHVRFEFDVTAGASTVFGVYTDDILSADMIRENFC
jgi:hypothetical protein